jgi:hypothetical protein
MFHYISTGDLNVRVETLFIDFAHSWIIKENEPCHSAIKFLAQIIYRPKTIKSEQNQN